MGFKKILVALDYSPLGRAVFDRALELAQATGASLRLLHCMTNDTIAEPIGPIPVEMGFYPEFAGYSYRAQPQLTEKRLEEAQIMLQNFCQTAQKQGVTADFDCQIGEASQSICKAAQNWGADLLVLGRRGRTGLTEALMGSVSNYVMHHAPCSVLVIQSVDIGADDGSALE
ncbi:universal stress protein [Planktothrix sp. FACHB-1355]|uniref:Universal stress protein n=1 Tax=Aerosakkonema funiforme FACHB-1375 TaxID=2949571 RepID=A0A926VJC1_9CYAN|nr:MULTISPECIES: universal stress protein [Oscillatoriales]MBD2183777.1 universal stress protein [Aerosakkonema funiforme FACHB-1375]MBD3557728.1 universal stress protein [Planktothrix sp. FACHB-1355]